MTWRNFTVADGSDLSIDGKVKFTFKCGSLKNRITAQIFPSLNQPLILGISWLQMVNPHINWSTRTIFVEKNDEWMILPQEKRRQSREIQIITAKLDAVNYAERTVSKYFCGNSQTGQ